MAKIKEQTEYRWGAIRELQDLHTDVAFTVDEETNDVINVAIQLKDAKSGKDASERRAVLAYFSDDEDGDSHHGADGNMSVAIGTDGLLIDLATDGPFLLVSEADGDIDIDITKTDTGTIYLVVIAGGQLHVSPEITFA